MHGNLGPRWAIATVFVLAALGCEEPPSLPTEKTPLPVSVMTLTRSTPDVSFAASGTVKSWKTESIGFEIPGRVQWVLEPGQNISGHVEDADGNVIAEGTPLAKIDPARYEVAVASAEADLEVAKLQEEIAEIRLKETLPADIRSAEADSKLADDEFKRASQLRRQSAIAEAEYDAAANRVAQEKARLSSLNSTLKQASAELRSAKANVQRAQQALADARRDLKNTVLYGGYRGQISEVDVVPGSVVSAGSPVLKLQMMDPIKIEIEVSAEQSRRLRRRQQVPVTFTDTSGKPQTVFGLVYVIDPSADPATRTFTVTLLVLNSQYRDPLPKGIQGKHVARTQDVWPLDVNSIIGVEPGTHLVEEQAIETVDGQHFVYLMTNAVKGQSIPDIVKLQRREVEMLPLRIPYLGNWVFRQVRFVETPPGPDSLLAGALEFPDEDRDQWNGCNLVFDAGPQWMLRPGDLVSVNLSTRKAEDGFFVPLDCIHEESGTTSLFVLHREGDQEIAHRVKVNVILPDHVEAGTMVQVQAIEPESITAGDQIIVGGVHYLNDGQVVTVRKGESW
ncbi:efflux RND transporter periplasmic adaptor subunit [Crateriforma conspicua]|uniref:Putative efflux pump membrane fusion protein n=1 Tax=Crateriforma conspicua TaxID=2527996 RepID=A0A5C5Y8H9_9PLAN|nr:HlyD family efflux transporter periplasmic adaptor subunit [Crateriforma conspicua]QDV61772.1 putative efflux pump membrane fusion protein [Crateriforma conspicua]TWT71977.1 putative efflux pump membrane fusion protein [Crateriforma conspicua]